MTRHSWERLLTPPPFFSFSPLFTLLLMTISQLKYRGRFSLLPSWHGEGHSLACCPSLIISFLAKFYLTLAKAASCLGCRYAPLAFILRNFHEEPEPCIRIMTRRPYFLIMGPYNNKKVSTLWPLGSRIITCMFCRWLYITHNDRAERFQLSF
jgi:hypothetical protein